MNKTKPTLESLQYRRKQLLTEIKLREEGLNARMHYLEDNFGSMLIRSISPFDKKQTDSVDDVLNVVNDVVAEALPSLGLNKEKSGRIIKLVEMMVLRFVYKKAKEALTKKPTTAA